MSRNQRIASAVFERMHADYTGGSPMKFLLDGNVSGTGIDPHTGDKIVGHGSFGTAIGGDVWCAAGVTYRKGSDPDRAVVRIRSCHLPPKVIDVKISDLERASAEFKSGLSDRYHIERTANDGLAKSIESRQKEFDDEMARAREGVVMQLREQDVADAEKRRLADEEKAIRTLAEQSGYGDRYGEW